ncbi:thioesterase II family protein [Streptomyces sp. NPDC002125]
MPRTDLGDLGTAWFRRHPVAGARIRLLCLPHAGGSAVLFRTWQKRLPLDVEVVAVQYPGRQDRLAEPCVTDMDELVGHITTAVRPLLDLPLAVFGHSMGSSAAYETAKALEQKHGFVVDHLFVSGRGAPYSVSGRFRGPLDDKTLIGYARGLGGRHAAAYDEPILAPLIMPALRGDFQLLRDYRPLDPVELSTPVTAFGGESDPVCTREELLSWARTTSHELDVRTFPGGHFYLMEQEEDLLAQVSERLTAGHRPGTVPALAPDT